MGARMNLKRIIVCPSVSNFLFILNISNISLIFLQKSNFYHPRMSRVRIVQKNGSRVKTKRKIYTTCRTMGATLPSSLSSFFSSLSYDTFDKFLNFTPAKKCFFKNTYYTRTYEVNPSMKTDSTAAALGLLG